MGTKWKNEIYLGYPCVGRLYHLRSVTSKNIVKVLQHHEVGSYLWLRKHGHRMMHDAYKNVIISYMPVRNYTCHRHKQVKNSMQVHSKQVPTPQY